MDPKAMEKWELDLVAQRGDQWRALASTLGTEASRDGICSINVVCI
jgi:hypothetical protein